MKYDWKKRCCWCDKPVSDDSGQKRWAMTDNGQPIHERCRVNEVHIAQSFELPTHDTYDDRRPQSVCEHMSMPSGDMASMYGSMVAARFEFERDYCPLDCQTDTFGRWFDSTTYVMVRRAASCANAYLETEDYIPR